MGNAKLLIICLLLAAIFSGCVQQGQQPSTTSSQATKDVCSITLSKNDWRSATALGLALSSIFAAALYLYGSALDSSFKQKAKNELYQLAVTATIAVMFVAIVQFMCGPVIPDLFGFNASSPYDVATNYLRDLTTYTRNSYRTVFAFSLMVDVGSGFDTLKWSRTLQGFITSTDYLKESIGMLFGTVLTSYMATLMQMQLLDYVQLLSLTVLLPSGIVLRSIFFTRKFGGALMGGAIAFYLMVPFMLMVNKVMVDPFFQSQQLAAATCVADKDCYSHNCNLTSNQCIAMYGDGVRCQNNFQCASGYCSGTCQSCSGFGESPANAMCCQGFMWNGKKCVAAKPNDKTCQTDSECVSWFCDKSKSPAVCASHKIEGSCVDDKECFGRNCDGISPNKQCVDSIRTFNDQLLISARVASSEKAGAVADNLQTTLLAGQPSYALINNVDTRLTAAPTNKSLIDKVQDAFIGSVIAGIFLPIINILFISRAVRDMSAFLGAELDIASIWRVI